MTIGSSKRTKFLCQATLALVRARERVGRGIWHTTLLKRFGHVQIIDESGIVPVTALLMPVRIPTNCDVVATRKKGRDESIIAASFRSGVVMSLLQSVALRTFLNRKDAIAVGNEHRVVGDNRSRATTDDPMLTSLNSSISGAV